MSEQLIPRHLCCEVESALRTTRVVNVIGPRQAGKTTLVRDLLGSRHFVSLDDTGVLAAMEADPYGQLTALTANAQDAPVVNFSHGHSLRPAKMAADHAFGHARSKHLLNIRPPGLDQP